MQNVPLVIEPTTPAIEVRLSPHLGAAAPQWIHFVRVPPTDVLRGNPDFCRAAHFFADSAVLSQCRWLLGYDISGAFALTASRTPRGFVEFDVPEELLGESSKVPSLRICFSTQHDRDEFHRACSSVWKQRYGIDAVHSVSVATQQQPAPSAQS